MKYLSLTSNGPVLVNMDHVMAISPFANDDVQFKSCLFFAEGTLETLNVEESVHELNDMLAKIQ
jgi:hypothetical protein